MSINMSDVAHQLIVQMRNQEKHHFPLLTFYKTNQATQLIASPWTVYPPTLPD